MIEHDIDQEVHMANYIMLRRINDVLMLLLRNVNEEDADTLATMHEEGIFATPNPAFRQDSDA